LKEGFKDTGNQFKFSETFDETPPFSEWFVDVQADSGRSQ